MGSYPRVRQECQSQSLDRIAPQNDVWRLLITANEPHLSCHCKLMKLRNVSDLYGQWRTRPDVLTIAVGFG